MVALKYFGTVQTFILLSTLHKELGKIAMHSQIIIYMYCKQFGFLTFTASSGE